MPPKFKRGQTSNSDRDRVTLLGLESSEEEEEELFVNSSPHVPHHAGRTRRGGADDPKIRQVQDQVSGVITVMKDNINRVLDRGDKLEDLEEKSGDLAESASRFRVSSRRLERQMWWKNCRLRLFLVGFAVVIVMIIIGVVAWKKS